MRDGAKARVLPKTRAFHRMPVAGGTAKSRCFGAHDGTLEWFGIRRDAHLGQGTVWALVLQLATFW